MTVMCAFSWSLASWTYYFAFLQVMYDATGVRLHAGRQAEVLSYSDKYYVVQFPPFLPS